jgi:hypothetical protein
VVALAARGGHPTGDGRASDREVPRSLQDGLITLIAIVYVLTIAAVVYAFFRYKKDWVPRRSQWLRNFFLVLVLMAVIVPVGYRALVHSGLAEKAKQAQQRQREQQNGRRRVREKPLKPLPGRTAEFNWSLALGVGGLVVLGGALLLLRTRRPPVRVPGARLLAEELIDVAAASIEDLRNERDPRKAVIAAYANMERVLASHGLPRRRAEAPFEYLARILRELDVSEGSVHALTELFEYAKFSTHEIDAAMKEQAIAAFAALRDELQPDQAVAA